MKIGIFSFSDLDDPIVGALLRTILDLKKLYPRMTLQVLEAPNAKLQKWILNETVGIAVVDIELPQFARFNLGPIEPLVVVANPLFKQIEQESLSFSDLLLLPLALPSTASGIRQSLEDESRLRGLPPLPVFEIDALPLLKAIVKDGPYVTVLPASFVRSEVEADVLRAYGLTDYKVQRNYYAVYTTARALTPIERDFYRILQRKIANPPS